MAAAVRARSEARPEAAEVGQRPAAWRACPHTQRCELQAPPAEGAATVEGLRFLRVCILPGRTQDRARGGHFCYKPWPGDSERYTWALLVQV